MRLPYLFLGLALFALVNIPKETTDRWRGSAVRAASGVWSFASFQTGVPSSLFAVNLSASSAEGASRETVPQRQMKVLEEALYLRYGARPAQVIFRDPTCWSSSLWISLGERDNRLAGHTIIGSNSPVLSGNSLVGVVEYVGEAESRMRLITDAGLVPSVRAVRGGLQNKELSEHLQIVLEHLHARGDLFPNKEEHLQFEKIAQGLFSRLHPFGKEESLAKGELSGSSAPLWRSRGQLLKGIGFNYTYADAEGKERDLSATHLKSGDLLATSGLDGVFPPGIPVAIVTKVFDLKKGSYFYELEAKPTAGDLQDLEVLFVMPPLSEMAFGIEKP